MTWIRKSFSNVVYIIQGLFNPSPVITFRRLKVRHVQATSTTKEHTVYRIKRT